MTAFIFNKKNEILLYKRISVNVGIYIYVLQESVLQSYIDNAVSGWQ